MTFPPTQARGTAASLPPSNRHVQALQFDPLKVPHPAIVPLHPAGPTQLAPTVQLDPELELDDDVAEPPEPPEPPPPPPHATAVVASMSTTRTAPLGTCFEPMFNMQLPREASPCHGPPVQGAGQRR